MDQAMEVLQRMYSTNAQYRSRGQQQAMEYILGDSTHGTAGTGSEERERERD
jgi:hypothetical protein